jgi:Cu/Ag efflux pump CusA
MMRWLVGSSLRFHGLVLAVAAVVMLVGVTRLRDAPVDVLPEFGPPTVEIQAEALGLSAVEVEQLITVPFEQDLLNGVAFLDEIRSESLPGLARIQLVFEPGTDLFRARQVVNERLAEAQVALPGVSKPPQMLQPLSSTNRVMMVGLSSREVSPIQMSVLARWTITPRLLAVPGVANVAVWGFRDRQLQVQVDPEHLRSSGVSLSQVVETTGNALWASPLSFVEASVPGTGGFIDTANQRLGVMHVSPIATSDDLAQVRVEGTAYRLGDVARVVEDHQPLIGDANGGSGLVLVVEKFPEANTLDVTKGVEEAIDVMRPGLSGLEFDTTIFRPASFLEESIDNLTLALILGGVLLALVLAAFLFDWRAVLIGFVTIPLSLLAAGLVLYALGETINAMVVAGFAAAVGLLVFDAVSDVENVTRRLRRERRDGREPAAPVVLEAMLELRGAAVCAALIVALALLPLFVLGGVAGEFFPSLAVSYLLAVLASLAVALTVTPAFSLLLLSRAPLEQREPPLARRLLAGYDGVMAAVLRRPLRAYVVVGALLVAGLAALPFLRASLTPSFKERELLVHLDGAPGTSLPEMNRITSQAARELRALPGVENVGAHVGRAVTSDQAVNVNSAELWVGVDPDADYDATLVSVEEVVDGYPGLVRELRTFSAERVDEVLAQSDEDLVVRVYGEDLEVLQGKAEEVRRALADVDGVVEEHVALPAEEPTLEIAVDLAAAQQAGIKPGEVRRAAATLLSGIAVGSLFEAQKVFDVVVWGVPDIRRSVSDVRDLLIDTPTGGHVRLGEVADVRVAPSPNVIRHEAVSRYVDVEADVSGRRVAAVVGDVERRLDEIQFPLEYHAEVLGPQGRTPQGRLIAVGIAVALGVLLLLQAAVGSWRLAILAFAALPLALSGGALGALAAGGTISLGTLIGFFGVLGIFARNEILLIRRFQELERERGEPLGPELVLRGTRDRLLPIVTTALATGVLLAPVVALGEIPGLELVRPLAVVVLGGLVTSTLLSLLVLPAVYVRVASRPSPGLVRRFRERAAAEQQAVPRI